MTKQWTAKWPHVANVVFRIVKNLMIKVTFAGESPPVVRLVARESTGIDNEDSEPEAQVRLRRFPEENAIFSKTHYVESNLSLHRRSQGGQRGHVTPQNFLNIWSFCTLRGVFSNKVVLFA